MQLKSFLPAVSDMPSKDGMRKWKRLKRNWRAGGTKRRKRLRQTGKI